MRTMFIEGGFTMWVILALGLVTLASAFWFAVRPDEAQYGFVRWMIGAIGFATLGGLISAAGITMHAVSRMQSAPHEERVLFLITGFAETSGNGVFGCAFLMLTALLVAVGRRRLDARTS